RFVALHQLYIFSYLFLGLHFLHLVFLDGGVHLDLGHFDYYGGHGLHLHYDFYGYLHYDGFYGYLLGGLGDD
ncbi:unnamed protein product, partial [Rotaria magnacalcarata]